MLDSSHMEHFYYFRKFCQTEPLQTDLNGSVGILGCLYAVCAE